MVAFIHREAYYIQRSSEYRAASGDAHARFLQEEHQAEIILGKNRAGPMDTIRLWCDVACSTMADKSWGGA